MTKYTKKHSSLLKFPFRPLGNLSHIKIWHDNTGIGNYASWYLSAIIVRDVQTEQTYEFIAHKWFGVEKDDGLV